MKGHANPQRLVDAAVGVRKFDVEYVDSVAECHKLFATGRYAAIPASIYIEREPDPLTAGVAQDQEAGLSSTGMVCIRRDVLDGTLKGGEGDGGIIVRPLPDFWGHTASPCSALLYAVTVIGERRSSCASAYVRGPTSAIATLFCWGMIGMTTCSS